MGPLGLAGTREGKRGVLGSSGGPQAHLSQASLSSAGPSGHSSPGHLVLVQQLSRGPHLVLVSCGPGQARPPRARRSSGTRQPLPGVTVPPKSLRSHRVVISKKCQHTRFKWKQAFYYSLETEIRVRRGSLRDEGKPAGRRNGSHQCPRQWCRGAAKRPVTVVVEAL